MNKLDLDKIITSFDEIKEIFEEIQSKLDAPKLKNKYFVRSIVPKEEIIKLNKKLDNIFKIKNPNNYYDCLTACIFKDPKAETIFYLVMKEDNFYNLFLSYFHELGHIANHDSLKVEPDNLEKKIISESLAEAFAYWAIEEYNQSFDLKVEESLINLAKRVTLQRQSSVQQFNEYNFALEVLLFFHKLFGSSKKTYLQIQDLTENHFSELAEIISNRYISNK